MTEPRWRTFLCWGSVILFLTVPISILGLRLVSDSLPDSRWTKSLEEAKYIIPYFQSLTALVFGLAGLNTWDKRTNHNNNKKPKSNKEPPVE